MHPHSAKGPQRPELVGPSPFSKHSWSPRVSWYSAPSTPQSYQFLGRRWPPPRATLISSVAQRPKAAGATLKSSCGSKCLGGGGRRIRKSASSSSTQPVRGQPGPSPKQKKKERNVDAMRGSVTRRAAGRATLTTAALGSPASTCRRRPRASRLRIFHAGLGWRRAVCGP